MRRLFRIVFFLASLSFFLGSVLLLHRLDVFSTLYYKIHPPIYEIPKESFSEELLTAINKERAKEKLPSFKTNNTLNFIAYQRALIIQDTDDFSHAATKSGKTFVYFANELGYPYRWLGENMAKKVNSVEEIVSRWMASPKHRDNLLDPRFKEIGIASLKDSVITVVIFGALLF